VEIREFGGAVEIGRLGCSKGTFKKIIPDGGGLMMLEVNVELIAKLEDGTLEKH
jgi:hypothetical protein